MGPKQKPPSRNRSKNQVFEKRVAIDPKIKFSKNDLDPKQEAVDPRGYYQK